MYAYEIPGLRFSLPAGGDVDKYRFVKVNSDGEGVLCSAGDDAIGVSMNETAAGEVLEIADGIVMVEAGGAVATGAVVQAGTNGKAVTLSTGIPLGIALVGASGSGELITVKFGAGALQSAPGADGKNLIHTVYESENLAAGAGLSGEVLFVVPAGYVGTIISADIVSGGTASGIDNSNKSTFELFTGTSTALAGVEFNATNAFPTEGESASMTLEDPADVDEGEAIKLSVTNGTTADLPAFKVMLVIELNEAES